MFGILIIEDLIAIFLLTILTTISRSGARFADRARSHGDAAGDVPDRAHRIRILTVPRAIRAVQKLGQPETTLVASIGICFAAALLALSFGYSVALGAFIAGSLVAESGHEAEIEHLVAPGARHVRRDLLRLGRNDHRSDGAGGALGSGARPDRWR